MAQQKDIIHVVVDTNVWGDLMNLFEGFKEISGLSYEQIWKLGEEERDYLVADFKRTRESGDADKFNKVIKVYDRMREMAAGPEVFVIHVPSFVFNEAGYGVSAKINSPEEFTSALSETFSEMLDSLQLEKIIDGTSLSVRTSYPKKNSIPNETIMKDFLKQVRDGNIERLKNHMRNANEQQKRQMTEKTKNLNEWMKVVQSKFQRWDKAMIKSAKIHGLPYKSRTESFTKLIGRIRDYQKVNKIAYGNPVDELAKRLVAHGEDLDFFDLQIFLYAREEGAHVITGNTQAYQQINDPIFLGYFDDVKIIHPEINFDNLDDLRIPKDLSQVIETGIIQDLRDVDLALCAKLDNKLENPVIEREAIDLIEEIERNYDPSKKTFKIKMALGDILKAVRIDNNQLKVSQEFIAGEHGPSTLNILQYIDEKFFNFDLNSNDILKDNVIIDEPGNKILENQVLGDYLNKNENVKQHLSDFHADSREYLDLFIERYRGKSYPEVKDLFQALVIKSHFPESQIEEGLLVSPPQETLPLGGCPMKGVRKRETGKCLLEWDHIEEFNDGRLEKRDPLEVKIDSHKFIEYLKTIEDPQQRKQLLEFADQVLNLAEDHTTKISGPKVAEVTHLVNNGKVLDHFSKVHHVSSSLNNGIFARSLLAEILSGNMAGVAFNLGFMAGSEVFPRLAEAALARGAEFVEAGRVMLGTGMRCASPFIGRFMSPLILIDLFDQIKAFEDGDKDAIVGVMGDTIFLVIDAVDIGISLLEMAGLIAEISSMTGPIGMAIGALVMVGTEVFLAVRKVQKLDKVIHLTTGERWELLATSFFTLGLIKLDVERLGQIKAANNKLAEQALEALKQSKDIQRIVVPSAELRGDDTITITYNNMFTPDYFESNIKWHRVRPDDPEGGRIFCAPEGDWENPPSWIMARCGSAIGVADLTEKTQNYTLFSLGDGEDYVQGFKDSPNIFRIGGGKKEMRGGDKNDVFIIEEGTTFGSFPEGYVDGMGGSNILDLRGLTKNDGEAVAIFFQEEPAAAKISLITDVTSHASYQPNIDFFNIDSVIGRENEVDYIYTNCSTKYVDGRGGLPDVVDQIHIPHTYKECNHDKVIQLGANTMLVNEAITGKFSYFVNDLHSDIRCTLKRSLPFKNLITDPENNQIEHKFFVNRTLSDIVKLEFHHDKDEYYDIDIRMYFKDKSGKVNRFHLDTILGNGKNNGGMDNIAIYLKDNVELRYHHNGIYALLKSNKPVLDIIKKYQPIAIDFDISVFIFIEKEGAVVSIGSDQKDDVLHNDPAYKTYLVGNKGNNAYIIVSGSEALEGPTPPRVPDVEIYSSGSQNHTSTLDLHSLSRQIKQDLGKELLMKHVFDQEKLVLYLYTAQNNTTETDSYNNVTTITFRYLDSPEKWDTWCTRLHVVLNNAPVVLKCDEDYQSKFGNGIDYEEDVHNYKPSNYHTPLPLVFSDYEMVVIGKDDVEPHGEVVVRHDLGQHRFLRLGDDLVLTNGFDFKTPAYRPTTVMIKNFYKDSSLFLELKFVFNDKVLHLIQELDDVRSAMNLEDWYKEYETTSNDIIGQPFRRSKRDLGTDKEYFHGKTFSEFEQSQLSDRSIFGTVVHSLSNIFQRPLNYFNDYLKSPTRPRPINVFDRQQNSSDFLNRHRIAEEKILESKTNIPASNENKITYTNFNSTLLLLDTLVRKLSDSKYKLPTQDGILTPEEHVQKKMVQLTSKLGLDYNDISGSIEKHRQRILKNMKQE